MLLARVSVSILHIWLGASFTNSIYHANAVIQTPNQLQPNLAKEYLPTWGQSYTCRLVLVQTRNGVNIAPLSRTHSCLKLPTTSRLVLSINRHFWDERNRRVIVFILSGNNVKRRFQLTFTLPVLVYRMMSFSFWAATRAWNWCWMFCTGTSYDL